MKLKSLFVAGLFLVTSTAFAQFFPARVHVSVLPGQVSFQVMNPHFNPIICNGQVFGRTIYGQVFTSFFAEQFMRAGEFRYAYVNAIPYAPFTNGWANIHCRFAGWY